MARPKPKPKPVTSPPPGSYDPAIDAQVGQVNRGLADMLSDYVRDYGEPGTAMGGRAGEDYGLGVAGVERDYGRGVQDIELGFGRNTQDVERGFGRNTADVERGYGRNIADLLRDRGRGREDYDFNIQGLERSFAQLGAGQTQVARAAGVQRGGALAQALAKRNANKAIARQPIDAGFNRFNADSQQAEGRLGEDRGITLGRLGEDRGVTLGRLGEDRGINLGRLGENRGVALTGLGTGLLRGTEDAATQLARAQRENAQFGLDATAQKFFQADLPLNQPAPTPAKKKKPVVPRPTNGRRAW